MRIALSVLAVSTAILSASFAPAQEPAAERSFSVVAESGEVVRVRLHSDARGSRAWVALGSQGRWRPLAHPDWRLLLRWGTFDGAALPSRANLDAPAATRLAVVQFETQQLPAYTDALRRIGTRVVGHLPIQAAIVRLPGADLKPVADLPFVRSVAALPLWMKMEEGLAKAIEAGVVLPAGDYNALKTERVGDAVAAVAALERLGGEIVHSDPGSWLLRVRLSGDQIAAAAALDSVLWLEPAGASGVDVDLARTQAGADYIESMGGFTGKGLSGWVTEGVDGAHPEFAPTANRAAPLPLLINAPDTHGTNTAGIIYARGVDPLYRGFAPDARLSHTSLNTVQAQRDTATALAVDPNGPHFALLATASWGGPRTTQYTSESAEIDDVLFRHDLPFTQSQSNAGNQNSRPQAWGKNVMSVGGIRHNNDPNRANHNWGTSGSTGPAADGRFKPEMVGFYDNIGTTSPGGGYTNSFGGTSGATPIVNGAMALTLDMITDGVFGHEAVPGEFGNRFDVRPHATTPRALMINTAWAYPFAQATRSQQGWGYPDLQEMYDRRGEMLVINESVPLQNLERKVYFVQVAPGQDSLRVTMVYQDPAGLPAASLARVNDLDLRVETFDGSTVWFGNNGLDNGQFSASGGAKDGINTAENVFLDQPAPGTYVVIVEAASVVQDARLETPEVDADFALVIAGTEGYRNQSRMQLRLSSDQAGDARVELTGVPAGFLDGYTVFSLDASEREGFGSFFGIERDFLSESILVAPLGAGQPFRFDAASAYPNTNSTYQFPPSIALALQGTTIDAVALVFDSAGLIAVSNAARVTIQ